MQAGTTPSRSETHVGTWRCAGDSRGTTAPGVGAELGRCGGGGATRHRRPAPRWVHVAKAYQTRSYGFVQPFYSPFSHDQSYNRIFGQMSTKTNMAPCPPPRPGTWTAAGGGRGAMKVWSPNSCARPCSSSRIIHERKWRANNRWQVAGFTASMVSTPPTLLVASQAGGPPATRPNHCLKCHYVPKLIHSQADSFTVEFYPSRGSCGYALLSVPVTCR